MLTLLCRFPCHARGNDKTAPAPSCYCPADAPLRKTALNSSVGEGKVAVLPADKALVIVPEFGELELVSLTPI